MKDVNALPKKSLDYLPESWFLILVVVMLAFQVKLFLQWQTTSGPPGNLIQCFASLGNTIFILPNPAKTGF